MRVSLVLVLLALSGASAANVQLNPITRVAQLLEGLSKKVEADGKAEEDLFEKYVCWYKTVVSTKSASNAAAADRIEALTAYIDDVESGRVEFTSERGDLTSQLAALNADLEKAADIRAKEHEDFLAAKDEMEKAIAALKKAVDVLGSATEGTEEGTLLATKFDLRKVVDLGRNMLSDKDAKFLEKVLDGETPDVDWKKLNRKATFKMKYKGRSFKIQEILADMLQTFEDNLEEAKTKEADTESSYQKLKGAKEDEKSATEQAASDMSKETAARNQALAESNEERDALTDQKTNDEKFIEQTEEAHSTKLGEWKERKRLRTEELASISKAIGILTSDDARDLFKKSFDSQGYLFLQQKSADACSPKHRARKAVALIKKVGTELKSTKFAALATKISMSAGGHFDAIIKDLEEQAKQLNAEEEVDLGKKEQCEEDRQKNTKIAKEQSQKIDDQTAFIDRKNEFIADLNKKIADANQEIDDLNTELAEAREQRGLEKTAYDGNKAADESAVGLIEQTMAVLNKFYEDNGLALVQGPGDAPPPPPQTWSEPYGGAQGESNGIQGILGLIKEDVEKDIKVATQEEKDAIKEFEDLESETASTISLLEGEIADFDDQKGQAEQAITETESQRQDTKNTLDDTIDFLKGIAPDCDYISVNFEIRKKNRWAERDGLEKAKAILSGASGEGTFLQKGKKGC
jgi:predicted  nucleic acid-binding Zn-ribbon protein